MDTFITTYKLNIARMLLISLDDPRLMVMLIAISAALIIFGIIFAKMVFKSESNIFAVILSVTLPVLLVAAALTVGDLYIIDRFNNEALEYTFQIVIGVAVFFLAGVMLANRFLALEWWKNTIILVMVYVMTLACGIMTKSIVDSFDTSKETINSYKNNNQGG